MTAIQEHYTEAVRQTQEAALAAVDTWTRTVQDAFGQIPALGVPADPSELIDKIYDFAGKVLDAQRDFAKNVVHTTTSVAENLRKGAARTAESAEQPFQG